MDSNFAIFASPVALPVAITLLVLMMVPIIVVASVFFRVLRMHDINYTEFSGIAAVGNQHSVITDRQRNSTHRKRFDITGPVRIHNAFLLSGLQERLPEHSKP